MQTSNCLKQSGHAVAPCTAAHTGLHITSQATGYFEGTWVWTADHDLGDSGERGKLTSTLVAESSPRVPTDLSGSSEPPLSTQHAAIVQYSFVNSKNVYAGLIQTETAYYQPNIYIYGAGHYSFFSNYGQDCLTSYTCQTPIVKAGSDSSNIYIYGLSTVGTTYMLNVDGAGIIKQSDNRNGFASTATIWTLTSSTRKRMRIEGRKALANDGLADIAAYARL